MGVQAPDIVAESLDSIMKLESDKSSAAAADLAAAKQRMIYVEKSAIRDIVGRAFEPVAVKTRASVSMLPIAETLEPVAPAATQPVWQAGEPMVVNVDYD